MICALCGKCRKYATQSEIFGEVLRFGSGSICHACQSSVMPGHDRVVSGLVVRPAFAHTGAMRTFALRMKYHDAPIPDWVVAAMADRLPDGVGALVPIPRSHLRRFRYGCDPAASLAAAIARRTGVGVVSALAHPFLAPRRAGRSARQRSDPDFRAVRPVTRKVALVDDVVTTGRTLIAAAQAIGGAHATIALTLTSSD